MGSHVYMGYWGEHILMQVIKKPTIHVYIEGHVDYTGSLKKSNCSNSLADGLQCG